MHPPNEDRATARRHGAAGGSGRARARRVLPTVIGALLSALGLFWALQGVGAVHVQPIFCVSECRPVERSDTWLVIGAVTCVAGVLLAARCARRAGGSRSR